MTDAALFIGWGATQGGRERKAVELFGESLRFLTNLVTEGRLASVEPFFLEPHGGDLGGFVLLRGSADQMSALRASEDFERITTRASLIVENIGVVGAYINEGLARAMGIYQGQLDELT